MSIIALEIFVIVLLTLLNGILAMSEIAVVSARKSRLQQWAEGGNRRARMALHLSKSPERFLSTIQVGITLVGVLAGAFGGATLAQQLAVRVATVEILAPYAETIAVALVVLAITYLSLVLGELVPKRIALNNPEHIAAMMAAPIGILSRLGAPVVWFLTVSTDGLLRLLRKKKSHEHPISEEEIRILIRQWFDAGAIEEEERDIAEQAIRLGTRRVSTVMTPRKDLVVLLTDDTPGEILAKIQRSPFAVFPLCEGSFDNVLGIVRVQDILARSLAGEPIDLRSLVHDPVVLPESVPILGLLEELKKKRKDTVLLLDEYGGLQGLITATDILRSLLREVSYRDVPRAELQSDGSWIIDGLLPVADLKDALGVDRLPEEERGTFQTAGGFVSTILGRIPAEGDTLRWDRFDLKVTRMDGLRIATLQVVAVSPEGGARHHAPS